MDKMRRIMVPLLLLALAVAVTKLEDVTTVTDIQAAEPRREDRSGDRFQIRNRTSDILTVKDFQLYAKHNLPAFIYDFANDGSHYQFTVKENEAAFHRYRILPRLMQDVSVLDTAVTLLGDKIPFPIAISPLGVQKLIHPERELGIARAAAVKGTVMVLSSTATTSVEEVARLVHYGLKWMQMYVLKDRPTMEQIIQRAERNGFKALVVSLDIPAVGYQFSDMRSKLTWSYNESLPNLRTPSWRLPRLKELDSLIAKKRSWEDLKWIRSKTRLPIVVKGILTGNDAFQAVYYGASAILVSNQGGRQLDQVPATIDAIAEVVEAVQGRAEVYLDGGVRTGYDVFKALSRGARAVFIGRPAVWGLAYSGQSGVERTLDILNNELREAMTLAGVRQVNSMGNSLLLKMNHCGNPVSNLSTIL